MLFSDQKKAEIVLWYQELGKSPVLTMRKFHAVYGRNSMAPDPKSIKEWYQKLVETGSVGRKPRENVNYVRTDEVKADIIEQFEENPTQISSSCFLWGYIKAKVYTLPVLNLNDLQERIETAFREMPQDMVDRSIGSYEERLRMTVANGGQPVVLGHY